MNIEDLSWNEVESNRFNSPLLPKSIRGIIVGKSGCGKTTLLLNLLLKPKWLDYDNLCVFRKSLFQPEYRVLKKALEERLPKECILELFNNREEIRNSKFSAEDLIEKWSVDIGDIKKSDIECSFFETSEDVPDPRDLETSNKNLMIFDDLLLEKQSMCECYYIRGRHSNVDCFYLSQNFFKLPRHTIRENANFICFFRQDQRNINPIYDDHVSGDMPKKEFRKFCYKGWKKPFGFVTLDLSSERDKGKYRHGFDEFYIPEELGEKDDK